MTDRIETCPSEDLPASEMDPQPLAKAAFAKQQHAGRIAAVNHWRGQCLDNFARGEHAILATSERLLALATSQPFKLEEAAGNRTKVLIKALVENWPKNPISIRLNGLLDQWSIREKERNQMVHGRFAVKSAQNSDWVVIIDYNSVKKGVCLPGRAMLDERQAQAFLKAIIAERRLLEGSLAELVAALAPPD